MVSIPLVSDQIENGAKLIARLIDEGFPVTAAGWVQKSDGDYWSLYLASPVVARHGAREGFQRVQAVLDRMPPPFRMDLSEIKLIGPSDQIAKALVATRDRSSRRSAIWHTGGNLGMMPVELAYVYPSLNGTPSSDAPPEVA